jgi:hypothetical protein
MYHVISPVITQDIDTHQNINTVDIDTHQNINTVHHALSSVMTYDVAIDYYSTHISVRPGSTHMTFTNTHPNGSVRLQLNTDDEGYHIVSTSEPYWFLSPNNELYVYKIVYEPVTKFPCIARLIAERGTPIATRAMDKISIPRVFVDRIDRLEPEFYELCCVCCEEIAVFRDASIGQAQTPSFGHARTELLHDSLRYTSNTYDYDRIRLAWSNTSSNSSTNLGYCFSCSRRQRDKKLKHINWMEPGKSTLVGYGEPPMSPVYALYRTQEWMPTISNFNTQHSSDCGHAGYYAMFTHERLLDYVGVRLLPTVESLLRNRKQRLTNEYRDASNVHTILKLLLHDTSLVACVHDYIDKDIDTYLSFYLSELSVRIISSMVGREMNTLSMTVAPSTVTTTNEEICASDETIDKELDYMLSSW